MQTSQQAAKHPKVLVIGEREVFSWSPGDHLSPSLAFVRQSSYAAWVRRYGSLVPADSVIVRNLLPPDPVSGAWDATAAKVNAHYVESYADERGLRMVFLGRRVARAFGMDFPLGSFIEGAGGCVDCLVLPHPSGRSRAWNDPVAAARYRRLFEEFVAAG